MGIGYLADISTKYIATYCDTVNIDIIQIRVKGYP